MKEMIERAANAIAPKAWAACGKLGIDNAAHDSRRKASLKHARAALATTRDPTPAMIAAGDEEALKPGATALSVWQAMWDQMMRENHA